MSELIIDVDGTAKSFGSNVALDHVDLQVEAGTVLGLPSGIGLLVIIRSRSVQAEPSKTGVGPGSFLRPGAR